MEPPEVIHVKCRVFDICFSKKDSMEINMDLNPTVLRK